MSNHQRSVSLDLSGVVSEHSVADYLLAECRERGDVLTNLKLQKLLYYADAWYLALRNRALFSEPFRAWVHGPVLLSQYHRFKAHQWRPILDDIVLPELDADAKAHLDETIEVFGIESAIALEQMTHEEAPWLEARGGLGPDDRSGAIISKETTADYYRAFAEEEES